jgi:hypothetical protein
MISRCSTVIAAFVRAEPSASAAAGPATQSEFEFQVWGEAKMPN